MSAISTSENRTQGLIPYTCDLATTTYGEHVNKIEFLMNTTIHHQNFRQGNRCVTEAFKTRITYIPPNEGFRRNSFIRSTSAAFLNFLENLPQDNTLAKIDCEITIEGGIDTTEFGQEWQELVSDRAWWEAELFQEGPPLSESAR